MVLKAYSEVPVHIAFICYYGCRCRAGVNARVRERQRPTVRAEHQGTCQA